MSELNKIILQEKLSIISEKNSEILKLKMELFQESSKVFDDFRKEFFIQCPDIKSFSWSQYTPYFNDGDTCTFSANTDYLTVNGEHIDDCDWYQEYIVTSYGTYDRDLKKYVGRVEIPNFNYNKTNSDSVGIIIEFLSKFDNDFYMTRFGDHCEITVTADGIETGDYEHD